MINIGKVGVERITVRCHIKDDDHVFDLHLVPSFDEQTKSISLTDQNGNKVLSDLTELQQFVDTLKLNGK